MTNETEKAGATRTEAVKAKAYAMPEEAACHYLIEEYEKLEAELSTLRASQQAPLPGNCLNCGLPQVGHWEVIGKSPEGVRDTCVSGKGKYTPAPEQQAPVERLPEGLRGEWMVVEAPLGWAFHKRGSKCEIDGCVPVELNTPGTAARLAALENKEKE